MEADRCAGEDGGWLVEAMRALLTDLLVRIALVSGDAQTLRKVHSDAAMAFADFCCRVLSLCLKCCSAHICMLEQLSTVCEVHTLN